jgi:diketogulonate reductase-like aldo/keto reductase
VPRLIQSRYLQLETIIKATGVVPAANQIERHALLQSNELIAYAKEKGIHITAYSVRLSQSADR